MSSSTLSPAVSQVPPAWVTVSVGGKRPRVLKLDERIVFGSGEDTDVQVLGTALAHLSLSLVKLKSTIHLQATSLDPDAVIRAEGRTNKSAVFGTPAHIPARKSFVVAFRLRLLSEPEVTKSTIWCSWKQPDLPSAYAILREFTIPSAKGYEVRPCGYTGALTSTDAELPVSNVFLATEYNLPKHGPRAGTAVKIVQNEVHLLVDAQVSDDPRVVHLALEFAGTHYASIAKPGPLRKCVRVVDLRSPTATRLDEVLGNPQLGDPVTVTRLVRHLILGLQYLHDNKYALREIGPHVVYLTSSVPSEADLLIACFNQLWSVTNQGKILGFFCPALPLDARFSSDELIHEAASWKADQVVNGARYNVVQNDCFGAMILVLDICLSIRLPSGGVVPQFDVDLLRQPDMHYLVRDQIDSLASGLYREYHQSLPEIRDAFSNMVKRLLGVHPDGKVGKTLRVEEVNRWLDLSVRLTTAVPDPMVSSFIGTAYNTTPASDNPKTSPTTSALSAPMAEDGKVAEEESQAPAVGGPGAADANEEAVHVLNDEAIAVSDGQEPLSIPGPSTAPPQVPPPATTTPVKPTKGATSGLHHTPPKVDEEGRHNKRRRKGRGRKDKKLRPDTNGHEDPGAGAGGSGIAAS